jgi:hypothetical protein
MKHIDKLKSSLIIAFVAGFIYYAFADFDTIKKIPYFAYETFKSAIGPKAAPEENVLLAADKKKNENVINTEIASVQESAFLDPGSFPGIMFPNMPDFSNYIKVGDFGGGAVLSRDFKRARDYSVGDFGFDSDFGPSMVRLADFRDWESLDSNEKIVKLKIRSLDSLNIYLDEAMSKLGESLTKMSEQLNSEEFLKALPHFDSDEFKVEIDFDSESLKNEIEESMKDFKENMKDFDKNKYEFKNYKFDMNEFKDSMEKFKEDMEEYKENMEEYKENMKELQENMKEYKEGMKELKKKIKNMDSSKSKKYENSGSGIIES